MSKAITTILAALVSIASFAEVKTDTTAFRKTGFSFGALPSVAYDHDLGFQYGVLSNLYWYGDGSNYPRYNHSLYLECSRYLAGTMLLRGYFDSRKLIPDCRTTIDLTWFNDLTCDFSGFNGHETRFRSEYIDKDNDDEYITSIFYKHKRRMTRAMLNIRKDIENSKMFYQIGANVFNMDIGPVQRHKLRHSVPDEETLYEKYVRWNLIKTKEADGGLDTYLRAGWGIDTRDNEAFATSGIWTEVLLAVAPEFLSKDKNGYGKLTIYHRQYFNLYAKKLVFAYRLGWQQKLWGDTPFYLLPHWNTGILGSATSQGLGGGKTLRGIVRNRIVGDGSFMGNLELRYIFLNTILFGQNFSVGTNLFADMGMVTQRYKVNLSNVPQNTQDERDEFNLCLTGADEKLHTSTGIGLKIAMNSNFVISADWGKALDNNDGTSGFYVMMNYLF